MDLRKIIVSVLAVVFLFFVANIISSKIQEGGERPKPKVTIVSAPLVKVRQINNILVEPKVITEGKLSSANQISVALEGKGTLNSSVDLKAGTTFKKGQRIAYVVDEQIQANFQASLAKYHQLLTASLIDIQMEYPDSKSKWEAFTAKIGGNQLPELPKENNQRLTNYLSSKGIYNVYYDLKALQTSLTKRSFSAPFDGYVIQVFLQDGSFINGTSKICEIAPLDKLELEFSLDEQFSNELKIGNFVYVNGQKARIIRMGREINNITQQKLFTAELTNTTGNLLAGDFVKITVPLSAKKVEASIVPAYCMDKNKLYVLDQDSILVSKALTVVGEKNDSLFVTGLKNNEWILFEAFSNFNAGQKVRPIE